MPPSKKWRGRHFHGKYAAMWKCLITKLLRARAWGISTCCWEQAVNTKATVDAHLSHTRTKSPESKECYWSLMVLVFLVLYHNKRLLHSCFKVAVKNEFKKNMFLLWRNHRYTVNSLYTSGLHKCSIYFELRKVSKPGDFQSLIIRLYKHWDIPSPFR